jgi:site-specific recombinase XerD
MFHKRLSIKDFECTPAIDHEIGRFRKYLHEVAGLRVNTIIPHCNTVAIFLCYCFEDREFSPDKLSVNQIQTYLLKGLSHVSASSKRTMLTRIRSYLRFLEFEYGFNMDQVLRLPMTAPVWKQAGLPKYLSEDELDQLFAIYNPTKPNGIRDYAIARCLKDLGLRCCEVAGLSLDDFDWIQGTLTIRNTKNHADRMLTLKEITGNSISEYLLHSRPLTSERTLFVRSGKNRGNSMGTAQVRRTVRYAAMKADLGKFTGTHMLRYTTVKEMLDNGTDFKIIADVLGHESLETTKIYAKLDLNHLREVAGTWPEAVK